MNDNKQVWHEVLESVRVSVSPAIFTTWFSQTHLVQIDKTDQRDTVQIGCNSAFVKTTIETRYFGLVQDALAKSLGKPCDLLFTVKDNPDKAVGSNSSGSVAPLFEQTQENDDQLKVAFKNTRIKPFFTFANFAVSSSNQMAWAAAEAVAKNPGVTYNPLFIWGGVGVGKTHLMNAVGCQILEQKPDAKIYFCTGEDFTNDIVEGIMNKTTQAFRNKYRKLDALFIDDIQFIAGKDAVQEEFFHTFNTMTGANGQIIMTSDRPPPEISKLELRLRSRFEAGLIVDIAPPDFELRCAILQIKAKQRGVEIPMDLVQLVAGNIEAPRQLEGFLIKLITKMRLGGESINEGLIKSLLGKGEVETTNIKSNPQEIINAISKHFSLGKRSLLGDSRARPVARPRQILMYFLRTQIGLPLDEVGRIVGRDHTTVMHAVDKITQMASTDVQIREDLLGIKNLL
jgi:chromosomal replication initiator protein